MRICTYTNVFRSDSKGIQMDKDLIGLILETRISSLQNIMNVGMLWWVSAVTICTTTLGYVWLKQDELKEFPYLKWFGGFISTFFISIVIFGMWIIYSVYNLHVEIIKLSSMLDLPSFLFTEFVSTEVAVGIGTTSFIFFTVAWFVMWRHITNKKRGDMPKIITNLRKKPSG